MASPPSAGNPIIVGPYKRIVGFHWPDTTPPVPVKYIWTTAFVKADGPGAPDGYSSVVVWDGVVGSVPGAYPDWQNYAEGGVSWRIGPYRNEFFDKAIIFDADGTPLTAEAPAASLGITITKPAIPQIVTYGAWEVAVTVSKGFGPASNTTPVTNPVSTFFADAGVCRVMTRKFYPTPPVQYYYRNYDPGTDTAYMEQWAQVDLTTYVEAGPCDLTSVSAIYDGLLFTPIGYYQFVDPYGEYAVTALLKSTAFAP